MSNITSQKGTKKASNPRSGLAIVLACITITSILVLIPSYYGSWTYGIAFTFFIIGLLGIGTELNKLSSRESTIFDDFTKGKGIFDSFFYGIALTMIWAVLHYSLNNIYVNIIATFFLVMGPYAVFLGVINWISDHYYRKRELEASKINIEADTTKKDALIAHNTEKYRQAAASAINFTAILVSIPSSIVAVIAFLDSINIINVIP